MNPDQPDRNGNGDGSKDPDSSESGWSDSGNHESGRELSEDKEAADVPRASDPTPPQPGAGGDVARRKQNAVWSLIGVSLVLGVIDIGVGSGLSESARFLLAMTGNLALLIIAFHWLNLDSRELGIRRPTWLNIGIVLLLVAFVPYYLYKTRPAGRRAPILLGFVAVLVGCVFASALGSTLAAMVTGTPIASAG